MGRDKAALLYHGAPQWRVAAEQLRACGADPFWSCSATQAADWHLGERAILDVVPGHGPASGLHAAFSLGGNTAWLVIGCDYPWLEVQDLQRLLAARAPTIEAVTYLNPATDDIEPLIALWEPSAQRHFLRAFANGEDSARRILRSCALQRLTPRSSQVLENRNAE